MIDYGALRMLAAVVQTGSFEKAAAMLHVTPSAVSQRVKSLEERLGAVLVQRASPCRATEKGERLCRHMENVGMLEEELRRHLPGLDDATASARRVTLPIATNADSLGTWFMEAMAAFTQSSPYLVQVAVDDQDHTADWLQRGQVVAAVTALEKPVSGCRRFTLGALRYHATASPGFVASYFHKGVSPQTLAEAPALTFNQKDQLQHAWIRRTLRCEASFPTHWLPSTQGFVDACLSGMGWGMNPALLVDEHLRTGALVELMPETPLDIPLYWQINRMAADRLSDLTRHVTEVARRHLVR